MVVLFLFVLILILGLIILLLLGTSIPYQAIQYKPINTTQGYISRGTGNTAITSTDNSTRFIYTPNTGFFQAILPQGVRCLSSESNGNIRYAECIQSESTNFELRFARITQGSQCLVANSNSQIRLGDCEDPNVLAIVPINNYSM